MSIIGERGLALPAARHLAVESLVAPPMTFLAGWIVDRRPARHVQTVAQGSGGARLRGAGRRGRTGRRRRVRGPARSGVRLWNVAADVVWPTYFGKKNIGSIRSITMVGTVVGAAFGLDPAWTRLRRQCSYTPALLAFALLPFTAAIAMRWRRHPGERSQRRRTNGTSSGLGHLLPLRREKDVRRSDHKSPLLPQRERVWERSCLSPPADTRPPTSDSIRFR
ncbi:MAG: hypothetical protein R2845_15620 [Thermomicrobiales bacterium]